jgi:FMN-dependent NADH-azoreductase
MAQLLYIESSPRKTRSASIEVSKTFLQAYERSHAKDQIRTIDLWKKELPSFDGYVIDSKYAILHGQQHSEEQKQAWSAVERLIEEFKKADKYVISIPMWNFSIPYILKHYIDLIVQPGYTFSFSPSEGYKGLVTGKPALLICARGGAYGAGSGEEEMDLQVKYMEAILKFIGFSDIRTLLVEPTLSDSKDRAVEAAKKQAEELAKTF